MTRSFLVLVVSVFMLTTLGCTPLVDVRANFQTGNEWRDSGGKSDTRYSLQPGLVGEFENGHALGVSYRRRDVSNGDGAGEDAVFLSYSIPVWNKDRGWGTDIRK